MNKHDIAAILEEIATLLELKGENPFKIRAYHNAVRSLEGLSDSEFKKLIDDNKLSSVQGIGKGLEEKIVALHQTGELPFYQKLKKSLPPGLEEMLAIPGLGAKKIKVLYDKLKIKTIDQLKKACEKGKVSELEGFGSKTEQNILQGLQHLEEYSRRELWWEAQAVIEPIIEALKKVKGVEKVQIAGSLRRKLETVGDIDILVASSKPDPIMDWFTSQDWARSITAKGKTKSSVRLQEGLQADLRIIPKEQFGFALLYFTGSKEHNIHLRQIAREKGYSLSEYAMKPLDEKQKPLFPKNKKEISEADIYKSLGLAYIPPELREDQGEIAAAAKNQLPKLVELGDIKGIFHNHTVASDGRNTLEEMAKATKDMGWDYIGIADHSKSSYQANGLDEARLMEQIEQIRKLNRSKKPIAHIFAGTECDILNEGELDFSDDILAELDFVIISVHRRFKMDVKSMTKRIIKALEHPRTTMLGHMTGRLLLKREPYGVNAEKIIDCAIANGKIIEINANPYRLDMDWRLWHKAKEKGLLTSINPDAHSTEHLAFVEAGVNVARKGWLTPDDVLNTWPLAKVKKYLG